jgi:DNA-binding FadR family transcriptional regulator
VGTPATSPRAFEAILEQLESAITQGALSAGDRLPSERELASNLGVSRTSVREALRVLEALGVVETRRGPEHGAVLVVEPGNAFVTIVRMLAALRHIELEEIVDFRATVESGAARRLAEHPNAEALPALERILTAMESEDVGHDEFHALDAEFHLALVQGAGNRLVNLLAGGLSSTLRRVITDVGFLEPRRADVRPRIVKEHRALFAAIRRGDEAKAAELANRHVRYWGDRVIALAVHAAGSSGAERAS